MGCGKFPELVGTYAYTGEPFGLNSGEVVPEYNPKFGIGPKIFW